MKLTRAVEADATEAMEIRCKRKFLIHDRLIPRPRSEEDKELFGRKFSYWVN